MGILGFAACGSVQSPASDAPATDDARTIIDGPPRLDAAIDAPAPAVIPSCVQLAATCGPDHLDSCCNSPDVLGGTYYRGFDRAVDPDSGNTSNPATISDFRLDKYEVSVGRFRKFLDAGFGNQNNPPVVRAGAHPNLQGSGWDATWNSLLPANTVALATQLKCDPDGGTQTWTDAATSVVNESRPINCVSWYVAMAFCAWDGGYLPTEAEWMYAAGGGTEQRALPWSIPASALVLDPTKSSYYDGTNCVGDGAAGCLITDLLPVGSRPAGDARYGQSDLGGNVAEWTLDYTGAYPGNCTDCAQLAPTTTRQLRGGSFTDGKRFERVAFKVGLTPATSSPTAGIRCARPALPHN